MIKIKLLHYELEQAGLPTGGVCEDGRIDCSRGLIAQEQITADKDN